MGMNDISHTICIYGGSEVDYDSGLDSAQKCDLSEGKVDKILELSISLRMPV